jgi:hypothetical protein
MRRLFEMRSDEGLACTCLRPPILTLASVGVSWAIAEVELGIVRVCHHLPVFGLQPLISRRGFESALAPNTSNNRSLTPDSETTFSRRRRRMRKPAERSSRSPKVRITAAGRKALAAED